MHEPQFLHFCDPPTIFPLQYGHTRVQIRRNADDEPPDRPEQETKEGTSPAPTIWPAKHHPDNCTQYNPTKKAGVHAVLRPHSAERPSSAAAGHAEP